MNKPIRGMTLIELLIAMAIFAVMSASIFVVFNSFQKTKEVTERSADILKRYQLAFNIIARDIQQIAPRPVRDEFGTMQPALSVNLEPVMEFTRAGWNRSPFIKAKRSELQRVAYYVEDQKLTRASWQVLDRAQDSAPTRTPLLDGVEYIKFELHYQDEEENWKITEAWPPQETISAPGGSGSYIGDPSSVPMFDHIVLPVVVDIQLKTLDFGAINRKFLIANSYWEIYHPPPDPQSRSGGGGGSRTP